MKASEARSRTNKVKLEKTQGQYEFIIREIESAADRGRNHFVFGKDYLDTDVEKRLKKDGYQIAFLGDGRYGPEYKIIW